MFSKIEQVFIVRHCPNTAHQIQNAAKIFEFFDRKKSIQSSSIDKLLENEFLAMGLLQAEITVAESYKNLKSTRCSTNT